MRILLISCLILLFTSCDQTNFKASESNEPPTQVEEDPPVVEQKTSLDLFLIVDDSGSMLEDNQKLAVYLEEMIAELDSKEIDWQMCITTTDVEYYEGRAIFWRNNDLDSHVLNKETYSDGVITDTVNWIGHGWSDDEQGVKAISLAIEEDDNADCFRELVNLDVILISDEDERSVGGVESLSESQYRELDDLNDPALFVDSFLSKFGARKQMKFHSVIVNDEDCKTDQDQVDNESFIGTKYRELSNLTTGEVRSICEPSYFINLSNP